MKLLPAHQLDIQSPDDGNELRIGKHAPVTVPVGCATGDRAQLVLRLQGPLREVGREVGVRHVLEGSVRKAGGRVRITAQLIDTSNDSHVWAEPTTARSTTSSRCKTKSPPRSCARSKSA